MYMGGIVDCLKKCYVLVVGIYGEALQLFFFSRNKYFVEYVFGPVVNAARGIAIQVQGAVVQFSINFQTALNPQITKSYALGDFTYMYSLIFRSSRFTFYYLQLFLFRYYLKRI